MISIALAVVLVTFTTAEPALALESEHACCLARAAAAAEQASCHMHRGTPPATLSHADSAQSECPNRCCLGTARQAARPESPRTSAVALHVVANVRAAEPQPLSQAELPAPSGRAPPPASSC